MYKADHISVDVMKNCLYSHEVRQKLLDSGINASKEFLQKMEELKEIRVENVKDLIPSILLNKLIRLIL